MTLIQKDVAGTSSPTNWTDSTRLVLQCSLRDGPQDEGLAMEIAQMLINANREHHCCWEYFHSKVFPSPFVNYEEADNRLFPQRVMIFIIDCRTSGHADGLTITLQDGLTNLYQSAGLVSSHFSIVKFPIYRLTW